MSDTTPSTEKKELIPAEKKEKIVTNLKTYGKYALAAAGGFLGGVILLGFFADDSDSDEENADTESTDN